MAKYQKLVEPFKIGNVELRNRFVMLPMTIEKVDNYHVTDDLVDFYEQRAKGHAGLIEIGSCYVCDCFGTEPKYHTTTGACGCWDDEFIPGFQRIAEVCHKHGSKVAAQLQLCYEWRASGDDPLLSYAPSKDVPSGPFVGMPEREYTKEEIAEVVKQYGQAARRCKDAGIDIIEIHAGIGYMVMRFLSKYSNHRTDEYGGSAENRARFLCEIIDSKTGEILPPGETGELVVTNLTKRGIPMLRYRTKDITRIDYEPCACGRTTARMHKIIGRSDDMLKIRGVNVFPSQVESALIGITEIGPHYQLVVRRAGYADTLEVRVELIDGSLLERYAELESLQHRIHDRIKAILGIEIKVSLVEPKSIERFTGKAQRVVDLRGQ